MSAREAAVVADAEDAAAAVVVAVPHKHLSEYRQHAPAAVAGVELSAVGVAVWQAAYDRCVRKAVQDAGAA